MKHILRSGLRTSAATAALLLSSTLVTAETAPRFSADIPSKITTTDSTETRIGTLRFTDGAPNADTVTAVAAFRPS